MTRKLTKTETDMFAEIAATIADAAIAYATTGSFTSINQWVKAETKRELGRLFEAERVKFASDLASKFANFSGFDRVKFLSDCKA